MEDLHSEVITFLKEKGYYVSNNLINGQIRVKYPINENKYNLYIELGDTFPYDFPRIFVEEEFKKRCNLLGHIFKGNSLCLKLEGKEVLNPTKKLEIIEYALEKATKIIDKAMNSELNDERFEELKAYWNLSNCTIKDIEAISFYNLPSIEQKVGFGLFHVENKKVYMYEDNDSFFGKDYLEKVMLKPIDDLYNTKCIFVRIDDISTAFELRSFQKLVSYLYSMKNDEVNKYLNEIEGIGLITIIIKNDNNIQYSTLYIRNKKKELEKDKKSINIIPELCEYINIIPRMFNQHSLFNRSSDGEINSMFKSVCIVGCGSIGSYIADALASIGVQNFFLIDNDIFEESNLLRHVCSVDDFGEFKVKALKSFLLNNYPYLDVKILPISIFKVKSNLFQKNQFDMIIVATGDQSSEFYCLDEFLSNNITDRISILWLEPYAVSGHAIVYMKDKWVKSSFNTLNSNINHISSVINRADFYLKESGCNSAYIPYSGLDLRQFVFSFITDTKDKWFSSFTYSKFLNINEAKKNRNMIINEKYLVRRNGEYVFGDIYD